ncbi:MAG: cytochrome-c oxidase, cbb3-type subunit I, partial [Mesorhizobium sp.]
MSFDLDQGGDEAAAELVSLRIDVFADRNSSRGHAMKFGTEIVVMCVFTFLALVAAGFGVDEPFR